jgi:branched-chain amino acid transport system ATP-binding protein
MNTLLKLDNVETWYGSICALQGISFEVEPGQITAVLGPNGAGKTTVLKTIMRSLYDQRKQQPEQGSIEFMGRRIERLKTDTIVRMGIGYVPEGREIFPQLTVRENILMGAYTRRDRNNIRDDIEVLYRDFPILRKRKNQKAGYLSGGEQQMLAIARALMGRPRLLMLDEPSLGLSPLLTHEIFDMLRDINRREGTAILLIEQNANMAMEVADYAYVMETGSIILEGPSTSLRKDEKVIHAYLGGNG